MIIFFKSLGSTHGKSIYNQSQAIKSNTIMWLKKKKGTWNQLVDNQNIINQKFSNLISNMWL